MYLKNMKGIKTVTQCFDLSLDEWDEWNRLKKSFYFILYRWSLKLSELYNDNFVDKNRLW